jgi:hypothetical protein
LIEVNLVLSFVPSPFTMAMMAREMSAAINPHSIAVAPVSSLRNRRTIVIMSATLRGISKEPVKLEQFGAAFG